MATDVTDLDRPEGRARVLAVWLARALLAVTQASGRPVAKAAAVAVLLIASAFGPRLGLLVVVSQTAISVWRFAAYRRRRSRRRRVLLQLVRLERALAALGLLTSTGILIAMDARPLAATAGALVYVLTWVGTCIKRNDLRVSAATPRLASEASALYRTLDRAWLLRRALVRDADSGPSLAAWVALVAVALATTGMWCRPQVSAWVERTPAARSVAQFLGLGIVPLARPCPTDPAVVRTQILASAPDPIGPSLYAAFSVHGRTVLGCGNTAAVRTGGLWVLELHGGDDPLPAVVGDGNDAAVVFSDFLPLMRGRLSRAQRVVERSRWGLGTTQTLLYTNSSCAMFQRYDREAVARELVPAVTTLAVNQAATAHAFPWLREVHDGTFKRYEFELVAPGGPGGTHSVGAFSVEYSPATRTASSGSRIARDNAACPAAINDVLLTAARLEAAVVAARKPAARSSPRG
jgi:hypothetical protein